MTDLELKWGHFWGPFFWCLMRLIALIALDARNWKNIQPHEMKEEVRDISQL